MSGHRDPKALQERIHYFFHHPALLKRALTHPSVWGDGRRDPHNAAFAFQGDAVIELAVRAGLVEANPDGSRGDWTEEKKKHVSNKWLAAKGKEIEIDEWLDLGGSELGQMSQGAEERRAGAVEALAMAIYLDQGRQESAYPAIRRLIGMPG